MILIAIMAETANHAETQPWPSLEWAGWIFDRASFVLIGSLVVGAVATIAIVWMGIVKEHHWDLLRERSNEKVAGLELETANAKAALGAAQADIAKSNARSDEANARALEAQLALEKFRRPRVLPVWKMSDFESALAPFAGTPFRLLAMNEPEAHLLAVRLAQALVRAKWTFTIKAGAPITGIGVEPIPEFDGIEIRINKSRQAEWSAAAQAVAGIFHAEGIDAEATVKESGIPSDAVHIFIGRKK
jgi:hypothetical protein